jgi:lycopene cyclase domain-containing protein
MSEFHGLYILVNIGCLIVPLIFSFHRKLRFDLKWKSFVAGVFAMMMVFIPWDIYFTSNGIWGFSDAYTIGWKIAGLPIEEWLFFMCIPYACLFTYHCMKYFFPKEPWPFFSRAVLLLTAIGFIVVGFMNTAKWYSFTAHLLSGCFLLLHIFILRSKYLGWFALTFVLVFPFFLISNGVLTGVDFWKYSLLNFHPEEIVRSVVWYNNEHNLGIRIFSMPLDDIAYGMLMLLLVTTVFEKMEVKRS